MGWNFGTNDMAATNFQRIKGFWRNEGGSGTIEFVLWLPAFVFIFILISDVSFIFYGKSQTLRILQDANRALSVGAIESEIDVENRVLEQMQLMGHTGVVDAVINSTTGVVTTTVRIPVNELTSVGSIPSLSNFDVAIISSHFLEQ